MTAATPGTYSQRCGKACTAPASGSGFPPAATPGPSGHAVGAHPHGIPERTLVEALSEFGPVTWPAYEAATAGVG